MLAARGVAIRLAVVVATSVGVASVGAAQTPLTRADAVATALARGARLAVSRADSAAAGAALAQARQFENPTVGFQRTESTPREHLSLDVPIDFPWQRAPRIGVAQAALVAAQQRFAFERAAVAFDADTLYTTALLALNRRDLTSQSARDADSLRTLAQVRRDAGDASDFDVQFAAVVAGQAASAAATDSLDAFSALLTLQGALGLPTDAVQVTLTDSLVDGMADRSPPTSLNAMPLLIAAAESDLRAARLGVTLEQRRLFTAPSISLGYETRDPGGTGNTTLPMFSLGLSVPLFNRNGAAIVAADVQRQRAESSLRLARTELASATARAMRTLAVARARVTRSAALVAAARRVAELSLLAYQEGAATLPGAIEAQRTAREARAQYLDALAAARNAAGLVRLLTFSSDRSDP
jgi:outer membrane protein TolC